MLAAQRQEKILEFLKRDGSVKVDELAECFKVSVMTVRRDLEKMEQENRLIRCHGGAIQKNNVLFDMDRDKRSQTEMDAKYRIASYCVRQFIHDHMVLYLDAGSTVLEVAKQLEGFSGLTVVTNDVVIACALLNTDVNVLVIGGQMQKRLGCIHGDTAKAQLEGYRMDASFVSSLCVDDEYDVYAASENKVSFRRKLLECSCHTYMLLDQGKIGHQSLYKINHLSEYSSVVTDKVLSEEESMKAGAMGIEWITV